MTLKREYFDYLDHFQKTVTLNDFRSNQATDLIALRHDIDHSIDVALEMAFWEHDRGHHATYYMLPGTMYWDEDPRFLEKCLQIQDFGHEIALHVNTLAEWYQTGQNPRTGLEQQLKKLRDAGLKIEGIAAHGDRDCYTAGFINYWVFQELRPQDPVATETGRTAEGIPAGKNGRPLTYPETNSLTRANGTEELPLWQVSMKELALTYHATHLDYDHYFTDSGGGWRVTENPIQENLRSGRVQINIHPIHWQAEPRLFFFLSPARSSSKWLTRVLEDASSINARHEHFLNFDYKQKTETENHTTGAGYASWIKTPGAVKHRLEAARDWVIDQPAIDRAEVNVYLERHVDLLKKLFPHASYVFLHRAPDKIVRSIMNRDWFDTAADDRHPATINVTSWNELTPFERCCHYVKDAMTRLFVACPNHLASEKLTRSPKDCAGALKSLDIAFYPRLAEDLFTAPINASKNTAFPGPDQWTPEQQHHYSEVCGPVEKLLDYKNVVAIETSGVSAHFTRKMKEQQRRRKKLQHQEFQIPNQTWFKAYTKSLTEITVSNGSVSMLQNPDRHGFVYLGLPSRSRLLRYFKLPGWTHAMRFSALNDAEYTVKFHADVTGDPKVLGQLFLVEDVSTSSNELKRRLLARLEHGSQEINVRFRPGFTTKRFCFLFNLPKGDSAARLEIRDFQVDALGNSTA